MNNTIVSIYLPLFLMLTVNKMITTNPIIQTISRQELKQQL